MKRKIFCAMWEVEAKGMIRFGKRMPGFVTSRINRQMFLAVNHARTEPARIAARIAKLDQ